jgi:NADH-quinone oxidoreductase subunit L
MHPLAGTAASLVWLLPLLPLLGFVVNGWLSLRGAWRRGPVDPSRTSLAGHTGEHPIADYATAEHPAMRSPHYRVVSLVGPGVIGVAFALALAVFAAVIGAPADAGPFVQTYGSWLPAGDLQVTWALQVDPLSVTMALIITGVGFLIHVFSVGYMADDPGFARYFAYLNLFVFFMLTLVLGASYAVIFVGWEGVGLASYLLIGFWFSQTANANAGKKAFIVNRIGDFGFLIAIFLLWSNLGSLDFAGIQANLGALTPGGALVTTICLFLFLGCAGKSAQMPLYIWLPDAMAGPTPVSALIHAATMVTAGVYLVARSAPLFALAPAASLTVVMVGAITAVFAAVIALKQWDIKKVLAYSTVSQLGIMFVAVGSGAYVAGVFHLTTHAFFKALLFLGAGAVIHALHEAHRAGGVHADAQDLRLMGGLATRLPVTATTMWIGGLALAALPLLSGFFSKDEILAAVVARTDGSALAEAAWFGLSGRAILWTVYAAMLAVTVMTAIYTTRLLRYAFHGPSRVPEAAQPHVHEPGWVMKGPLVALAVLALAGGWLNLPALLPLGPVQLMEHWLAPVLQEPTALLAAGQATPSHDLEVRLMLAASLAAIGGLAFAWWRLSPAHVPSPDAPDDSSGFVRLVANKFYVDEAIQRVIVTPIVRVARALLWRGIDEGLIDGVFVNGTAAVARSVSWVGSRLQSGIAGNYAWVMAVAVVVLLGLAIFG